MFSRISAALQRAALRGRSMSSSSKGSGKKWDNTQIGLTVGAVALVGIAASYAAVPLYQMFCRATGYFGAVGRGDPAEAAAKAAAHKDEPVRPITVRFTSDVSSNLPWSFVPVQKSIKIVPGETALAVYSATNHTDKPLIGVATYNVAPASVATYFVKVQCFCFEHQRLNPQETIDMPVLFYLDPEINNDPLLHDISSITLSYTFFLADREGQAAVQAAAVKLAQDSEREREAGTVAISHTAQS